MGFLLVLAAVFPLFYAASSSSVCQEQRRVQATLENINYLKELVDVPKFDNMVTTVLDLLHDRTICAGDSCAQCLNTSIIQEFLEISQPEEAHFEDYLEEIGHILLLYTIDRPAFCAEFASNGLNLEYVEDKQLELVEEHGDEYHDDHDHEEEADDHAEEADDHEEEADDHEEEADDHDAHEINLLTITVLTGLLNKTLSPAGPCEKFFTPQEILQIYRSDYEPVIKQHGSMPFEIISRMLRGECPDLSSDREWHVRDFAYALFEEFSPDGSCVLDHEGVEKLASALSIGEAIHQEDDGHAHDHRRKKRETDVYVINECLGVEELMDTVTSDGFISVDSFPDLAAVFVQQAVQGCPLAISQEQTANVSTSGKLTRAQVYGAGTFAVFIISMCSLIGILIYPCHKTQSYNMLLAVMLGLAVGSLTADALLHLIPHGLGLHDHDDHDHSTEEGLVIEPFVWKMVCVCASAWFFYIVQLTIMALRSMSCCKKSEEMCLTDISNEKGANCHSNDHAHDDFEHDVSQSDASIAWMVTIGDGVHNFADGLAIGAAFTVSWQFGLSTSLAVLVHELPHEFGDIAILLRVGWSLPKVITAQLVSAATAFVGLYMGIALAEVHSSSEWIFMIAAGMFIYVALGDVVPELQLAFKQGNATGIFLASNLGICIGYVAMFLLAIYEEKITVSV